MTPRHRPTAGRHTPTPHTPWPPAQWGDPAFWPERIIEIATEPSVARPHPQSPAPPVPSPALDDPNTPMPPSAPPVLNPPPSRLNLPALTPAYRFSATLPDHMPAASSQQPTAPTPWPNAPTAVVPVAANPPAANSTTIESNAYTTAVTPLEIMSH